jgi:subfamily B ATP-binding cassette protein MsbA
MTLIDRVLPNKDFRSFYLIVLGITSLQLINFILGGFGKYLGSYIYERTSFDLTNKFYQHLQKVPLGYFYKRPSGDYISRCISDLKMILGVINSAIPSLLLSTVRMTLILSVAFVMDWKLTLFSFTALPLYFLSNWIFSEKLKKLQKNNLEKTSSIYSSLNETFLGIKEIRVLGKEKHATIRLLKKLKENARINIRAVLSQMLSSAMDSAILNIWSLCILVFGGYQVLRGELMVGQLLALLMYISQVFDPFTNIGGIYSHLKVSSAAAERISEIFDTEPGTADLPSAIILDNPKGSVEFKDVWFGYEAGKDVLLGVRFKLSPGKVYALVGSSGAGKSTIVSLLLRLYEPSRGRILLDEKDVKGIKVSSLREQIAVTLQDYFIFSGSIRDNLLYGKPNATEAEIWHAAEVADALSFIEDLPKGFDSETGEMGVHLSLGQQQRIALARALLKDSKILVLDEMTSSLDANTERKIHDNLKVHLRGRTVLIVAHRLSSVQAADRIFVLSGGRITESGRHDELVVKEGDYYNLYRHQLRNQIATANEPKTNG